MHKLQIFGRGELISSLLGGDETLLSENEEFDRHCFHPNFARWLLKKVCFAVLPAAQIGMIETCIIPENVRLEE